MNVYLLVEGGRTELQLYPQWLSFIIPELMRVATFDSVRENSYYIFSGGGIPSIYRHAVNAIKDINSTKNYNYLIIALDSEELSQEQRKKELIDYIETNIVLNQHCKLEVIIHNRCIETWFLGNRKVYKRNPQGEKFKKYSGYYNVEKNDPELMKKLSGFSTTAHFHEAYLREMLKEYNVRYRKSRPKEVLEKHYFDELMKRVKDSPSHLKSFSNCIEIFQRIKSEIK